MPAAVKTNVTELPESRVRVEAEVPAAEVEKSLERAARQLARGTRVPGFRKGKVPPQVFIRRVGRDYVLDEAVRSSLGDWYAEAIDAAGIVPVGEPKLDMGDLPPQGQPLAFSIEIGVRPTAELGDYKGLEAPRREARVDDERVDHELEHLRERMAKLETVQRAAAEGDFVVVDYAGQVDGVPFEGGEGRDQLIELGGGRLIPGFEEQIAGASAGEERAIEVTFPDDYGAEHLAGKPATFALSVKEVRAKVLPELDDELAADAAGFDTLAELKDDVRERLGEQEEKAIEAEFREAVLDAAVANATVVVPDALVEARAGELWEQMVSSLRRRGLSKDAYLQLSGKTEQEIVDEAKPDAEQALRREAVLAAVVVAETVEPTDAELAEALAHTAEHEGVTPEQLLERVRKAGNVEALRDDVATRKALDLLVAQAKPISPAQAEARAKLWTPGDAGKGEKAPAKRKAAAKPQAAERPNAAEKPKAATKPKAAESGEAAATKAPAAAKASAKPKASKDSKAAAKAKSAPAKGTPGKRA
jgi:trigger factor